MSKLKTTKAKADIIEFDDINLVKDMCGSGHGHLALIEKAFGVYLEAPGASVVINGKKASRGQAAKVLKEIYTRLAKGWPCTIADVKNIIAQIENGSRIRISGNTIIPIPRRKPIVPKTTRQEEFIKAMGSNTIVFGVGPAGTGKTFLATAYGASLLARGEVGRFVACRPA
ncbi:MAG: PhoH family protein, partial [Robiginitomaculum sp.]|nr:PhoH family protein [Robiginitomaculum sp.]